MSITSRQGSGRRGRRVLGCAVALGAAWLAGCAGTETDESPPAATDRPEPPSIEELEEGTAEVVEAPPLEPLVLVNGEAHASLREALSVAPDDARIELMPGVHQGPLDLTRSVEIVARADAEEVAIESHTPVVVRVRAESLVTLRGLVLRATGPQGVAGKAAIHVNNAHLRMADCRVVSRQSSAIEVIGGQLDIQGGRVAVELWQQCVVLGQGSRGAFTEVHIENAANPGSGVEVWDSELELTSCRIVVEGGAGLAAGPGGTVRGNGCRVQARTGVWVAENAELTLEDSHVREGVLGARAAGTLHLRRTTIARCDVALQVSGPLAAVTVTSCELLANGTNLSLDGALESQLNVADTEL